MIDHRDAEVSRRAFLEAALSAAALALLPSARLLAEPAAAAMPLEEFRYEQVQVSDPDALAQRDNLVSVMLGLDQQSLLKPFRAMAGQPAPGESLGGWYEWKPDFDFHHDDIGFAPGETFGQWISAMARLYACSQFGAAAGQSELCERVYQLDRLLADAIAPGYFQKTRFAGYSYDKLVCGLIDAREWAGDTEAFRTLDKVTDVLTAAAVLPGHAIDRELQWKMGADLSWMWDETYTMPENLYLAAERGAGSAYASMARSYLVNDTYFEPLSKGVNALSDKHAYSYVNALCSGMQAYFVDHSPMHLAAAVNGFDMLQNQSFASGGWGPDELLRKPGYDELAKSLTTTHNSFEVPCGSYAHMKLTRYLLRATRDGRYGDSMERVMLNTVKGALPLQPDGRSFYYADYNLVARRVYSLHRWPCCSGTLPQVVADYGINSYFHEPGAVWVNLYHASEVRFTMGPQSIAIEQTGRYLDDGIVHLRLSCSEPARFTMRLRIPAWAGSGARLQVNGSPQQIVIEKGFAGISRLWRSGDAVQITFPMSLRLEALPANGGPAHPEIVALLRGPLVLMALREPGDIGPLSTDAAALLKAEQTGAREWRVAETANGRALTLVPFTDIGDLPYSMYLQAT